MKQLNKAGIILINTDKEKFKMMRFRLNSINRMLLLSLFCFILLLSFTIIGSPVISQKASESSSSHNTGYLSRESLPDSLKLIPPPPEKRSAAMALDKEMNKKFLKLRGTKRWEIASLDAGMKFPEAAETFSCALDAPITEQDTPHLYIVLRRSMLDAVLSTFAAKNKYKRERPFIKNKQPICTPAIEQGLRHNGSYPSGHSSIGWAWALILCELAPDRADAILARGLAFGESRLVCNVHWYSDVVWGRFIGAATVACLHANAEFCADMKAAKAELEKVRARGLKPTRDCETENKELYN